MFRPSPEPSVAGWHGVMLCAMVSPLYLSFDQMHETSLEHFGIAALELVGIVYKGRYFHSYRTNELFPLTILSKIIPSS